MNTDMERLEPIQQRFLTAGCPGRGVTAQKWMEVCFLIFGEELRLIAPSQTITKIFSEPEHRWSIRLYWNRAMKPIVCGHRLPLSLVMVLFQWMELTGRPSTWEGLAKRKVFLSLIPKLITCTQNLKVVRELLRVRTVRDITCRLCRAIWFPLILINTRKDLTVSNNFGQQTHTLPIHTGNWQTTRIMTKSTGYKESCQQKLYSTLKWICCFVPDWIIQVGMLIDRLPKGVSLQV